jgi:hypothetical protein
MQEIKYSDPAIWLPRLIELETGSYPTRPIKDGDLDDTGTASDVICEFDEIRDGSKVVIACRVSHRENKSHLKDQERRLRGELESAGGKVVGVVRRVHSGWKPEWLHVAVEIAKQHDAVILAESTSRLIRHRNWKTTKECWTIQPSHRNLQALESVADGVKLVTLLHPDASPSEERSCHTKRTGKAGRPRGRSRKKDAYAFTRTRFLVALQSRWRRDGRESFSDRHIARKIGRPRSTVRDWISEIRQLRKEQGKPA